MLHTDAQTTQRSRVVDKPWGHEEIFALVEGKFCGKVLHVIAGHALSMQYHVHKEEVISVLQGVARLEVGDSLDALEVVEMTVGDGVHLPPGRIHRVTAVTDVVLVEASTTELDDVVRLADDYGREDPPEQVPPQLVPAQREPVDANVSTGGAS